MYGGAALNAIHVLMRSLDAVLAGPNGLPPERCGRGSRRRSGGAARAGARFRPGAEELASQGARPLDPNAAAAVQHPHARGASADVNGIIGGKPGLRNTTLSVQASGEVTIRLAPGQDLDTIGAAAEKLMRAAAPPGAELDIKWAARPRADAPGLAGDPARAQGVRAGARREAAAAPKRRDVADRAGARRRGIATVITGFALPESNVHSPNEKFLVRYFDRASTRPPRSSPSTQNLPVELERGSAAGRGRTAATNARTRASRR